MVPSLRLIMILPRDPDDGSVSWSVIGSFTGVLSHGPQLSGLLMFCLLVPNCQASESSAHDSSRQAYSGLYIFHVHQL
jgi:hypothetical protein